MNELTPRGDEAIQYSQMSRGPASGERTTGTENLETETLQRPAACFYEGGGWWRGLCAQAAL